MALAKQLDFQAIIDLVGDRIHEIFNHEITLIATYDKENELTHFVYARRGETKIRDLPSLPPSGFSGHTIHTRQTIVVNEDLRSKLEEFESQAMQGEDNILSLVYVPIIAGEKVLGVISLQTSEREHAFSESDVRLLETPTR